MTTPTDQRINAAAVRLFTAKGTTQLSVSELAQEANVARGTLYRNVGSVEDLFDRIVATLRRPSPRHQLESASHPICDR